jgi:Fe-S-cluster containining protein
MGLMRQGNFVWFSSTSHACMMLDGDNLCRIEKEHGRELKPSACKLFPFNVFRRIGRTVAVTPHFLCPLRLQIPPRPGEVEGTHSLVEKSIHESQILDKTYIDLSVPRSILHTSLDEDDVLRREASFRDACSRAFGRDSFYETLRAASSSPNTFDSVVSRAARGLTVSARTAGRD